MTAPAPTALPFVHTAFGTAGRRIDPDALPTRRLVLGTDAPLMLDCGVALAPVTIAYETWGTLNEERSNAVLLCHALTLDQYAASPHPVTGKPGWWTALVGPGRPIDTERFFVICANVIGGCMGSTGPLSINPATGTPWGLSFPFITIGDMVRAQKRLVEHLGIDRLFCVLGGSMGGMQVLQWAVSYPEAVRAAIPIATSFRHTSQNIAFHEVGRQAIMADPDWREGRYLEAEARPRRGLAVARMAAHITYLSEAALHRKFGRNLQDRKALSYGFDADFQVESYLRHQGSTFVDRFDANSYLYITRAMDYFDLAVDHEGGLVEAFRDTPVRFCVLSFTSDWLFPTSEALAVVRALNAVGANVTFVEIASDKGHDAFLLDEPQMFRVIRGFVDGLAEQAGLRGTAVAEAGRRLPPAPGREEIRVDLKRIADLVEPGARVLDVGCGDGTLLAYLAAHKRVDARGMELRQDKVQQAVARGLSVLCGNANTDLDAYPSDSFDYVILSQTLQAMEDPHMTLAHLIRIGRRALVSFQNLGHWRRRLTLLLRGHMPRTIAETDWWNTPNIHECTITDFLRLCRTLDAVVERAVVLDRHGREVPIGTGLQANLFGEQAVFLLRRGG